jgi:hypothetical protein
MIARTNPRGVYPVQRVEESKFRIFIEMPNIDEDYAKYE